MSENNATKSTALHIRLTPDALAKIKEGRDKYAETLRKPDMSMTEYVEMRCSVDNMSDFLDSDLVGACVSSINFNKTCIDLMEKLIELFGDGAITKQICSGNKDLLDMVAWGKAVTKRMQNCAEIPSDSAEEE